ncbi:MAG: tetratricopeptide repeat protein [Alphaproteobacteria bacterium]|nr:tetratricopeptide repeat protein [Alphaproteobacteria bacterium]
MSDRTPVKQGNRAAQNRVLSPPDQRKALGEAVDLQNAGRLTDAERLLRRILQLDPDNTDAWLNMGNLLNHQGKLEDASAAFRKVVARNPDNAQGHLNLGACLDNSGRREDAIVCYRRALSIRPDYTIALANLGKALCEKGDFRQAMTELERAVELTPDYAKAHLHLGRAQKMLGNAKAAIAAFTKADALVSDSVVTLMELAGAQRQGGKADEAVATLGRVLELEPDLPEAFLSLGNAFSEKGETGSAISAFRRAIVIRPSYAEAHNNLGNALQDHGRLDDAIECYKMALRQNPGFVMAHSNLLLCQQYNPEITPETQYRAHIEFDRRFVRSLAREILPHANSLDPNRPIRVGYLSGGFRRHPVGFMITPSLRHGDAAQYQTYCYSTSPRVDAVTGDIKKYCKGWRSLTGVDDRAAAAMIRRDGIDILVDLAGHGSGARLMVLARKPAPVQVKWIGGLFNTTGLSTIDYLITDWVQSPEGFDKHFVEELVRLPDGYVCFDPPGYAPDVGPLPAARNGYVTFGCFNNLAKVTPQVIALWSRIMRAVPGSRIILKTKSLKERPVRDRFMRKFADHGITPDRVDLRPPSPHHLLLDTYNEIDIALDPFPYTGGLTTCEAMWMGTPVLTMPGETLAARHAATHLSNVGLSDWIVGSEEHYFAAAVRRSADLPALARLRRDLRQTVARSPLVDGPKFARNLEAAYRMMWRRWCEGEVSGRRADEVSMADTPNPDIGAIAGADFADTLAVDVDPRAAISGAGDAAAEDAKSANPVIGRQGVPNRRTLK